MAFYDCDQNTDDLTAFEIGLGKEHPRAMFYNFSIFAKGYFIIANNSALEIIAGDSRNNFTDYLAYPIFYNYRHFFELSLKYCFYMSKIMSQRIDFIGDNTLDSNKIERNSRHELTLLAECTKKELEAAFGLSEVELTDFCNSFINTAKEIDNIDLKSFLFRYPENTKGEKIFKARRVLSLRKIQKEFQRLYNGFEAISPMFSGLNVYIDEIMEVEFALYNSFDEIDAC